MDPTPPDAPPQPKVDGDHSELTDAELYERVESGELGIADLSDSAADRMFAYRDSLKNPEPEFDPDLIPQVDPTERARTEFDVELDRHLDGMSIVDAYVRWNVKGFTPKPGNKSESIMVRCPNPEHPDNNPSAWLNTKKNVWVCGGCGFQGGDLYDLAGYHYGFSVPSYKINGEFPKLRRRIAEEFGITEVKTPGGDTAVAPVITGDLAGDLNETGIPRPADLETVSETASEATLAPVVALPVDPIPREGPFTPEIDWKSLTTEDDFLGQWMEAVTIDDFPHEYRFWMGLQALGFAAGNHLVLLDNPPVHANFFLCLFSDTGYNKSRSIAIYRTLLQKALPHDAGDDYTPPSGVSLLPEPASGEALVDAFSHPIHDPSTNKVTDYAPVAGLVGVSEFSSFIAKSMRGGNTLKSTAIDMYDGGRDIHMVSRVAGERLARDPFCSFITTTQPGAVSDFLTRLDAKSGFLNRWVFVSGPRRMDRLFYMPGTADIGVPIETLKSTKRWADRHHGKMRLHDSALDAWLSFCRTNLTPLLDGKPDPITSRIELTLKKLILAFAINVRHEHPTVEDVQKAVSLFDYLLTVYGQVTKSIIHTTYDECAEDIIEQIHRLIDLKVVPSMAKIRGPLLKTHDRMIIERTITNMVNIGQISERAYQNAKGGPSTKIYLDEESERVLDLPGKVK